MLRPWPALADAACISPRRKSKPQALAVWKWYNFAEQQCPEEKRILRVNVDETSICHWMFSACGNVIKQTNTKCGSVQPRAKVPHSCTRRYFTYVAFICDDADFQACMPQVAIANEASLRVQELAALKQRARRNQVILREKSAWNNNAIFRNCIDLMLALLGDTNVAALHIILLFDVAKAHIHESTLRHCARRGLHVGVIPARTTGILQPLDTHVFSQYKHMLKKRYTAAQLIADKTVLPLPVVVMLVLATAQSIMEEKPWAHAFSGNGFSPRQASVRRSLLRSLQWDQVPPHAM